MDAISGADDALIETINTAVAAANEAEQAHQAAASQLSTHAELVSKSKAVGQLLLEAKERHPKVADFEAFLRRVNGLKQSRAYDLMRLAGCRATEDQLKQETRERVQKHRANKKLRKPDPVSVTNPDVTETKRLSHSPEISAEERRAQNAALDADPAPIPPTPDAPAAVPEADAAVSLQAAIDVLIDAAKHTVSFENVLPPGVIYAKADLDGVIFRLQSLNKTMAKRRKAARAEAA